eukprot:15960-Rhodomonas_salina.2
MEGRSAKRSAGEMERYIASGSNGCSSVVCRIVHLFGAEGLREWSLLFASQPGIRFMPVAWLWGNRRGVVPDILAVCR